MTYEELLNECNDKGLIVKEKPLKYHDGRIKGIRVAIRDNIPTSVQKACVLSEELGHFETSVGDILDMNSVSNRKQEIKARAWAYDKLINLQGFINAFEHNCTNLYETAEFLEVTEEFLIEAIQLYQTKYGQYASVDNYTIFFNYPNIGIIKKL
mgnify:CR=1 FL=1